MIALLSSAFAGPLPGEAPSDPSGVRVVLRGLVESWDDPALSAVYSSGTWLGGLGVVVPVWGPVLVDVEASFRRLESGGSTFEIAPLSALVEFGPRKGTVEPYAGLGPTWTAFTESAGDSSVQGARLAAELRGGLRVDTGLVRPPMPPAGDGPVRALEIELYLARRVSLPGGEGFALGAWRGSLGVAVAF
jgi:hypothetical protein